MPDPVIRAIVVNYNSTAVEMRPLLQSLKNQTMPMNITVVDNASEEKSGLEVAEEVGVEVVRLPHNTGFAHAVNVGAQKANEEFLLILNFDLVLKEDAVERMLHILQCEDSCIAVCPKILLQEHPQFLDSIGISVDSHFQAFNRGCGEPDIGQYDASEKVLGACFASVLLRRKPFLALKGLDDSYFLYYEDIDFSLRALRNGFTIRTCPQAVVFHHHSASLRGTSPEFKESYIRRNLLRTAGKNLCLTDFLRVWSFHLFYFLQTIRLRKRAFFARAKILVESLLLFPILYSDGNHWGKRLLLRNIATPNPHTFLNLTTYEPLRTLESYVYALERLCEISPEEKNLRTLRKWRALLHRSYSLPPETLQHLLSSLTLPLK